MGKAVKLLLDNHNRDPNNLNPNKKRPPPIKFYRSVGLQVTIEPSVRNGISKVVHVNNVNGIPLNGVTKPLNVYNNNPLPVKKPGPKSLTEPRAMKPTNTNNQSGLPHTVARGLNQMNGHLSPTKIATNNSNTIPKQQVATPTVVDLTDDVAPTESSSE